VTFSVKRLEAYNTGYSIAVTGAALDRRRTGVHYASRSEASIGDTRMAEIWTWPLLIGASLTNGEFILPRVIGEFQTRYPRVQMHLTVGNSEAIEIRVAERSLDIGFIESPSHLTNLETQTICEDELVVICAPGSELARSRRVAPAQLLGKPYVSREVGSGTREFADRYLRQHGVSPDELNVVMELGSTVAIKGVRLNAFVEFATAKMQGLAVA
jgi:DNA-binding transcriptional LysR family regulator